MASDPTVEYDTDLPKPADAYRAGYDKGREVGKLEQQFETKPSGLEQVAADAQALMMEMAKKQLGPEPLTAMEQILEQELDKAAVGQPEGEAPVVTCHVLFDEAQQISGAVKRGPIARTYVLGQQMMRQEPGQRPQVVEGKIAEVVFHGADIKRLVFERDVAVQLLGGLGGGGSGKIWTPPR